MLTGVYEPSEGTILLNRGDKEVSIGGMKPYKVTAMGIAPVSYTHLDVYKRQGLQQSVK